MSKRKGASRRKSGGTGQPSDAVLLAEMSLAETRSNNRVKMFLGACGVLVVLAVWPTAWVLAGKETALQIGVSWGPTVAVSVAGVTGGLWGWSHKRRADRLEQRNKALQERLVAAGIPVPAEGVEGGKPPVTPPSIQVEAG